VYVDKLYSLLAASQETKLVEDTKVKRHDPEGSIKTTNWTCKSL